MIRQIAVEAGYTVMAEQLTGEYRLDLCKGYTPQGFAEKVFHLHIRYPGDYDEVIFCEYLKKNPDKAQEYVQLKIELQKSNKLLMHVLKKLKKEIKNLKKKLDQEILVIKFYQQSIYT